MNIYKMALVSAMLMMAMSVAEAAGVGPGGSDFGRNPSDRDRGGAQPGGSFGSNSGNFRNDVFRGSPIVSGRVPQSKPPRGCNGCYNDGGGLQDGGSRGNHRSDRHSENNRSNDPGRR